MTAAVSTNAPRSPLAAVVPSPSYVIILLGADESDFVHTTRATVRATLEARLNNLGLDPTTDVLFLDEQTYVPSDADDRPIVAAYFGGPSPSDASAAAVQALCGGAVFVLPVVEVLTSFSAHVPSVLHPINGDAPEPGGQLAERVAARLLEQLGLLRKRRLAFISYKRTDSAGVANQLHDALEARSFEAFLDTYSVEKGIEFQPVLWDRMADADLVVLLDTKGAFTSRWVEEEISKARMMGLGILQLVWPGHNRTIGTELCDAVYLEADDFEPPGPDSSAGRLRTGRVADIASTAEALRARAFAARRARLVGDAQQRAAGLKLDVAIRKDGTLRVTSGHGTAELWPIVGHPDSVQLHVAHLGCADATSGAARLLYDPLGMIEIKSTHLKWLNEHLPMKVLPVSEVGPWLQAWSAAAR